MGSCHSWNVVKRAISYFIGINTPFQQIRLLQLNHLLHQIPKLYHCHTIHIPDITVDLSVTFLLLSYINHLHIISLHNLGNGHLAEPDKHSQHYTSHPHHTLTLVEQH